MSTFFNVVAGVVTVVSFREEGWRIPAARVTRFGSSAWNGIGIEPISRHSVDVGGAPPHAHGEVRRVDGYEVEEHVLGSDVQFGLQVVDDGPVERGLLWSALATSRKIS